MNWDQLKNILWLRWRLTRNQWARGGGIGAAIAAIVAVAMLVLGGATFIGGIFGGFLGLGESKPVVVMGVWLGLTAAFGFFWLIGLINELQRSETIDLQRLMHLPVALGQIFFINYLASHLAFSVVVFVPAMMGLALGLAFSRGPLMVLLIPLALGMVFMITAWTYCLRGWLATLMSNPRRRRTVIMVITIGFIMLAQAPNLYFNVFRRLDHPAHGTAPVGGQSHRTAQISMSRGKLNELLLAEKFVPPLWLPMGAKTLAEGRVLPALLGAMGCIVLGALGLRRSYQSTLRFYHGDSGGKAVAEAAAEPTTTTPAAPAKAGTRFLELKLPGVPEQSAAIALATFRSMLRAPEVKIAWGTSFLVTLIVGGSVLLRAAPKLPEAAMPFIATGAVVFSIFLMVQFLANQFGFDRDGFRALVLSPADRRLILVGKNLACLPASICFGGFLLVVISLWLRVSPFVFLSAIFQFGTLLLLAGMIGNVLSILVPYRIQPGSMKPTKMPGLAMLAMVICQMLFPLAMAPAFLPPLIEFLWRGAGWPKMVPVNLLLSIALAALTGLVYWQTLGPLGRLLQRRETKILSVVTVEVE